MFDPRDFTPDSRRSFTRPRRDHAKEREQRQRDGHRREYDPRTDHQTFEGRVRRAVADVGMYRSVAYRDLAEVGADSGCGSRSASCATSDGIAPAPVVAVLVKR